MNDAQTLDVMLKGLEVTIRDVRKIRVTHFDKKKPVSFMIVDIQLFLYLQSFDFIAYQKNFYSANTEFEKKLYCRLWALYCHEFIDDIRGLLGKNLTDAVKRIKPSIDFKNLQELKARIYNFSELYGKNLSDLRHQTIAHRGHDPIKQIELIEKIDNETFLWYVGLILKLSHDINAYLSILLEDIEGIEAKRTQA